MKFGSTDISQHYVGSSLVPRIYNCEDTNYARNETAFDADVLIIGGGGGGGSGQGGGGGGGGYREFTKKYYTGTSYTVTVGAGGSVNSNGSNSSIEKIAHGGGAGGNANGATQEACNGKDGGSGGGSGLTSNAAFRKTSGGNSISPRCNGSSQGYPGFAGPIELCSSGGAGGTGSNANGGPGKTSTITGTSVGRSGGGAPGFGSYSATDGGGLANQNGTANTGGGGGGNANGGSGFVCIKFPDTITITIGGGLTYTSSTSGGYTVVQFTAGTDNIYFDIVDPYLNAVSLLLQDSFTDESPQGQTVVIEGDAVLSTSEVKVGSYSFAFDDTGDRLTISADPAFAFGTGDYTVETWLFIPTHATTRQVRILSTTNINSNFSFEVQSTGAVRLWTGSSLLSFGGTSVTQGQWHHVAFCRASGVVRAFVDGSQIGSAISNTTNMINNQNIQFPSTNSYDGPACYMDGIRVTKAARYVSAFSPPTLPFPT